MAVKEYYTLDEFRHTVGRGKKHKFMVNVILHNMDDFLWFTEQIKLGNILMFGNDVILADSENQNGGNNIAYTDQY